VWRYAHACRSRTARASLHFACLSSPLPRRSSCGATAPTASRSAHRVLAQSTSGVRLRTRARMCMCVHLLIGYIRSIVGVRVGVTTRWASPRALLDAAVLVTEIIKIGPCENARHIMQRQGGTALQHV
jgi:hypothetical protein